MAKNYIEEYSKNNILPHEFTMGAKRRQAKAHETCQANFSQIFMLHSDPAKEIDKAFNVSGEPSMDVTDNNGSGICLCHK